MKKETTSPLSTPINTRSKSEVAPIHSAGSPRKPQVDSATGRGITRGNGGNGGGEESKGQFEAEQLLGALMALRQGDFLARLPLGWTGIAGKVADTFNEVAELLSRSTNELSRISRVVGQEGRIHERL